MTGEPYDDHPLDINIHESEGMHAMEGFGISSDQFLSPLKIEKVNIGSLDNPKFTNIGDYWDEETVGKIIDLLHEFQDMFSTIFSEMKGIVGDLGEIKIPMNPKATLPFESIIQRKFQGQIGPNVGGKCYRTCR